MARHMSAEDPMTLISASVKGTKVTYRSDDGKETFRKGGSRAWRNNNPGNISKGKFANDHGAIGGDSRFAIFPDEATGKNAIVALLKTAKYASLSLKSA